MYKIKKPKKEIGTSGNREIRRNPETKKDPITKKKGNTLMEELGKETTPEVGGIPQTPPQAPPQGTGRLPEPPPISPEDDEMVRQQLSSKLGEKLLSVLDPISRRDLHPNNLNISYDKKVHAIDIHIVFVDTNTPLWINLQRVMWRNRMTWRFDGTGPQLMLIIRWFLPYEFPKEIGIDLGKEQNQEPTPKEKFEEHFQKIMDSPEKNER